MRFRAPISRIAIAAIAAPLIVTVFTGPGSTAGEVTAAPALDLSAGNRRAPLPALPDWSRAGYRGGANLPAAADYNPDAACQITPAELASTFGVRPGDSVDDSAGLQAAIDAMRQACSPSAGYAKLSLISLPAGRIDVSRQLSVDANYLTLRGAGNDPATGTQIVFRPDANTRYDALTPDGGDWDEDGMTSGSAKGGWIWPGRGLFRVQTRAVHPSYAAEYAAAPANRKDLFEGTANVHWKVGAALRAKPGETQPFSARHGDQVIHLATSTNATILGGFRAGGLVNIRAANSVKMYQEQTAHPTEHPYLNQHLRAQLFTIAAVDTAAKTITIDRPLEYDLPVDSTSDGSPPIGGTAYPSKASPLVAPVLGVGFENFSFTQDMTNAPKLGGGTYQLTRADAEHNYGNLAPEYEMHGIVFKFAANSWVRNLRIEMAGSHPIVTEEAKNLQIVDNHLDGSWNKGKGGNGYFRGSRVWDSLYARNTSRNLRHFTFQWSSSHNVVIGNDFDSDLNLHGGWERHNLFELNTVRVPYGHRSGNCRVNCGEEGGGGPDDSQWYPIWWGAGQKAVKWSGSTGPQNVFFNNTLAKQTAEGGPFAAYTPYAGRQHTIFQFGWDGAGWRHLARAGIPLADWARNETVDYGTAPNAGVDATRSDPGDSLFLIRVGGTGSPSPTATASPTGTPTPSSSPSPSPSPSAPTGAALTATFSRTNSWPSGYNGLYTIRNGAHGAPPLR